VSYRRRRFALLSGHCLKIQMVNVHSDGDWCALFLSQGKIVLLG
jgi:hypothetical protein